MALGRRPARFERKISMSKAISPEKLELIRAAAARVYINNQEKPGDCSDMEANKGTGGAGIEIGNRSKEVDPDRGVKLLAAAAIEFARQDTKYEDPITIRGPKNN